MRWQDQLSDSRMKASSKWKDSNDSFDHHLSCCRTSRKTSMLLIFSFGLTKHQCDHLSVFFIFTLVSLVHTSGSDKNDTEQTHNYCNQNEEYYNVNGK